jgi:hypothetical protein
MLWRKEKSSPLPGIEPWFPTYPAHRLVTTNTVGMLKYFTNSNYYIFVRFEFLTGVLLPKVQGMWDVMPFRL